MTHASLTDPVVGPGTSRYWLLVHSGTVHALDWEDGERLLSLTVAVRSGLSAPQSFSFMPRRRTPGVGDLMITVQTDEPLELITDYEKVDGPDLSHWFG